MTRQRYAARGKVAGWFTSEEAVYLKVAVEDEDGRTLGWAKGVRVTKDELASMIRTIEHRMNETMQMTLPWEDGPSPEGEDVVRWLPPQP